MTPRAIKLDGKQAQAVLEEYSGPRYEIEKQTTVFFSALVLLVQVSLESM